MEKRLTTAGVAYRNGLFLVARRLPGGPLSEKWEFVGGKNRWGETIEDTLRREWMEELGVEVKVGPFILETTFENNGIHYILRCHKVDIVKGEPVITMHSDLRWVTKEELKTLDFGPSDSVIRTFLVDQKTDTSSS